MTERRLKAWRTANVVASTLKCAKVFFLCFFFSVFFAACHSRTTRDLFRVVIVYFEFLLLSCFCCIFFFHTWHLQRGVKSQPTRWHYRAGFTYKIKYWIGFFGLCLISASSVRQRLPDEIYVNWRTSFDFHLNVINCFNKFLRNPLHRFQRKTAENIIDKLQQFRLICNSLLPEGDYFQSIYFQVLTYFLVSLNRL